MPKIHLVEKNEDWTSGLRDVMHKYTKARTARKGERDGWSYSKFYGERRSGVELHAFVGPASSRDDEENYVLWFFAFPDVDTASYAHSGVAVQDLKSVSPEKLLNDLIEGSGRPEKTASVLTKEMVVDFINDPAVVALDRRQHHALAWHRSFDARMDDAEDAVRELLNMWQAEHPIKVGSVVISDVLPKRPVWTVSALDGKLATVTSSDGRTDEVPVSKLYADDRDLDKLLRSGGMVTKATVMKLARKLGVEDIVADLFNS